MAASLLKRKRSLWWACFLVLISGLCLMNLGCGGGSDSGSSEDSSDLVYTGLTTPAAITEANAQDIAASAYAAGSTTTISDNMLSMNIAATTDAPLRILPADITMVLKTVVTTMDFTSESEPDLWAETVEESETIDGSCGGTASISIQSDDETGDFSGSMAFNSYCEEGTTVTGDVTFSGSIDMSTGEPASITMQFDAMTTTNSSQSVTIDGEIEMEVSDASVISTLNMMIQDNETGKTSKVEDYQLTITDFYSYSQIEIIGRFYDSDYGYVDLETPTSDPLIIYYDDAYPSSGQLILTGENSSKARLTALSDTNCQVEADADGDGIYEYSSGPILWTEL